MSSDSGTAGTDLHEDEAQHRDMNNEQSVTRIADKSFISA